MILTDEELSILFVVKLTEMKMFDTITAVAVVMFQCDIYKDNVYFPIKGSCVDIVYNEDSSNNELTIVKVSPAQDKIHKPGATEVVNGLDAKRNGVLDNFMFFYNAYSLINRV